MADLSITVSNTIAVRPSVRGTFSLWDTLVWGTDFWYGDFNTPVDVDQWIANGITVADALDKRAAKWLSEGVSLSQTLGKSVSLATLAQGITVSTTASGVVTQGDWTRDEPDLVTWTEVDDGDVTWNEASSASTDWTES